MANTKISIANAALARVAKGEIQSLSEDSKEAKECNRVFDDLLLEMSEWTEWPELITRATLAVVTNDRSYEWLYAYAEPSDMADPIAIREAETTTPTDLPLYNVPFTLPLQDDLPVRFICEGGKIYTNVESAVLVYSKTSLTVADFTALQRRAFVDALAALIVIPLNKDVKAADALEKKALLTKNEAIADALNRTQRMQEDFISEAELARYGIGV